MKRRLINGIGLVCLILSVAATEAVATSVQVDNGDILTADKIQSIVIDNNIIKVTTNTTNPYNIVEVVGNPTPIVNLLADGQSEIQIPLNTDVTISWDVSNSTSCTTSGGTTVWQAQTITPDGQGNATGSVQILVDFENPIDFNLECSDDIGNTANAAATVTGTNDVPDPVVTLLVENATTTEVDGNTDTILTFSWNVSNAVSCNTSLGNSAWQGVSINPVDGSASSSVDITVNLSNATSFRLTCTGDGPNPVDVFEDVTVTINAGSCPSGFIAPLATDLTPNQRDLLIVEHSAIYNNLAWPFPQFASKAVAISRARYMAIEFNTGNNTGLDGGYRSVTSTQTFGTRFGAISQCPGDFSQHLPDLASACTQEWFIGGTLNWTTGSNAQSYECELLPNTTYYLNLTFTDGEDPLTDTCDGSQCITTLDIFHF